MTSKVDLPVSAESDDALEDAFFSRPPPPVVHEVDHPEDWGPPPAMSRHERSMMVATGGMVGAAVLVLIGFSAFHDTFLMRRAPTVSAPSPSQVLAAVSDARREEGAKLASAQGAAAAPALEPPTVALAPAAEPPPVAAPEPAPPTAAAPEVEPVAAAAVAEVAPEAPVEAAPTSARRAKRASARAKASAPAARAPKASSEFERTIQAARRDFDRGDAAGAQRRALDAIQLDPSRGYAYVLLGAARDALGNSAGARAAYQLCTRQATDRHVAACKQLAR